MCKLYSSCVLHRSHFYAVLWKLKEAEVKLRLEEEKTKLQRLQASKEVKVAAARVKAYNAFDNVESCNQEVDSIILPDYLKFKY